MARVNQQGSQGQRKPGNRPNNNQPNRNNGGNQQPPGNPNLPAPVNPYLDTADSRWKAGGRQAYVQQGNTPQQVQNRQQRWQGYAPNNPNNPNKPGNPGANPGGAPNPYDKPGGDPQTTAYFQHQYYASSPDKRGLELQNYGFGPARWASF